MRVALAAMPWHALNRPSLAVAILVNVLHRDRPQVEVAEYHGSIRWAEFLLENGYGPAAAWDYTDVADNGVTAGLGDWVFAGCLYDDPGWRTDELHAFAEGRAVDITGVVQMRELAGGFLAEAAAEILAGDPDVVGFTSTFMQNVPSLALARRLKQLRPSLQVVLGGANCDGPMGEALHRNHRFVDFVVRGEGEQVLPLLLDRIDAGVAPADLAGVCWWDGDGPVANPESPSVVPPATIPSPDFDVWHATLVQSPIREFVSPELLLQSSRGCWWGEKHQCTFCGLNGSTIAFRARPADDVWQELARMVERYQILDVVTVDLILDPGFFHTLLPRMAETGWDLRVHYEIKSNLRPQQVEALARAGVVTVQPGIENLNGRVLAIMDKGVDGAANVRLLRDCEDHGVTAGWNYLYGFPGERPEDYWTVIDQLRALVHLQPPSGATPLILERFSPHFERPELGFPRREPHAFYRHVYDLPVSELMDLAYFFDTDQAGITGGVVDALATGLDRWKRDYPHSYLTADDRGDEILIEDRRRGWRRRQHRLSGWQAEAYRALARPRRAPALRAHLGERGHPVDEVAVLGLLQDLAGDGLVFHDDTRWVALATTGAPHRIPADDAVATA
jgi:ribosomal peptide maturation radical SAM protein 1